jgi:hypothetical protein
MLNSRAARCAVILTAALGLASLAAVSTSSHEEREQAPAPGLDSTVGPGRNDAVAVPSRLVGLEIDLGLKDQERTDHEGEVLVSEGKVVSLDVVRSGPAAKVEGNRFRVETVKKVAK